MLFYKWHSLCLPYNFLGIREISDIFQWVTCLKIVGTLQMLGPGSVCSWKKIRVSWGFVQQVKSGNIASIQKGFQPSSLIIYIAYPGVRDV